MPVDLYFEVLDRNNSKIAIPRLGGSIGSSPNAIVVLSYPDVAKFHCVIANGPEGLVLVAEAGNTFEINGTVSSRSQLKPEDELKIGSCRLSVRASQPQINLTRIEPVQKHEPRRMPVPPPQSSTAVPKQPEKSVQALWFFMQGGIKAGPVSTSTLRRLLSLKTLTLNDKVCAKEGHDWISLAEAFRSPQG